MPAPRRIKANGRTYILAEDDDTIGLTIFLWIFGIFVLLCLAYLTLLGSVWAVDYGFRWTQSVLWNNLPTWVLDLLRDYALPEPLDDVIPDPRQPDPLSPEARTKPEPAPRHASPEPNR